MISANDRHGHKTLAPVAMVLRSASVPHPQPSLSPSPPPRVRGHPLIFPLAAAAKYYCFKKYI